MDLYDSIPGGPGNEIILEGIESANSKGDALSGGLGDDEIPAEDKTVRDFLGAATGGDLLYASGGSDSRTHTAGNLYDFLVERTHLNHV